jgi:hypothetical protein
MSLSGHQGSDVLPTADRLGIKAAMFYRLRTEVLEAGLASLEPRPMGRLPHTPTAEELRCAELNQEVEQLRSELKLAEVREEVARVMPRGTQADTPGKKTTPVRQRGRLGRKRRSIRRKSK